MLSMDSPLPEGWTFPVGCDTKSLYCSADWFLSGVLNDVKGYPGGALGKEPGGGEEQCSAIFRDDERVVIKWHGLQMKLIVFLFCFLVEANNLIKIIAFITLKRKSVRILPRRICLKT